MDPKTAAELLRQIKTGKDIPPAGPLLKITSAQAAIQMDNSPYSIATNLAHTVFWQQLWLDRLAGRPTKSFLEDWKVPAETEWTAIRSRFLEGLDEAIYIAESEPFSHKMKSDADAVSTLIQIAIHDSYHLGQINLLKRQLRLAKRKE
jgi:uncharacterized damage-inducible protein DinB